MTGHEIALIALSVAVVMQEISIIRLRKLTRDIADFSVANGKLTLSTAEKVDKITEASKQLADALQETLESIEKAATEASERKKTD